MNKVTLILNGWFQCSPDDWDKSMKIITIDNEELHNLLREGYKIIGNDPVKPNKDDK